MDELQPIFQNLPPLKMIMSLCFYLILGLFAAFTAVFYFHWTTYATDKAVSRFTLIAYMIFILPLLLIMGGILLII